jgi:hypothetical protein
MDSEDRRKRARLAARTRHHPNAPETVELARNFRAERLAQYIAGVVDKAPPLTQAQRDKLALLLRGGDVL